MPADILTPEARRENAAALAAAANLTADAAAEALDFSVAITADANDAVAQRLAEETANLLGRTVQRVFLGEIEGPIATELVIGSAVPRTGARVAYLSIKDGSAVISNGRGRGDPCDPLPPLLGLIIACYAAAATLRRALGDILPLSVPDPFVLPFDQLGIDLHSLDQPIELGHAYLAGAGAIGNGLLWAARHIDLRGQLDIADDDTVSSANLNRQIWFNRDDVGLAKVVRLAAKAQQFVPQLSLVPRKSRLQDLPERSQGPWLGRLIVAVDSRRARRRLQNEFPGEVFDASTTDIREVVLHHHVQPTDDACLSCIYEPDSAELSREQHIAEHLGVTVAEVRQERISATAAAAIARRFEGLVAADLQGTSYDTLFKTLCSESRLRTLEGTAVIAPFAFVSVLAGALLALELVRWLGPGASARDFNYWRLSPWHPPIGRRRVIRPRQPGCVFCDDPLLRQVNESLWNRR